VYGSGWRSSRTVRLKSDSVGRAAADAIPPFSYCSDMALADTYAHVDDIHLEARDETRNVRRAYRIQVSMDLFGHTVVEWWWGRIGTAGQARRRSFPESDEAARHLRALLRRRDTAPRRLGVRYVPVNEQPALKLPACAARGW
jgi:predicted DNA-binding WGR domain protein